MSEKPDRPYFLNSSATKFGYPILVFLPGMDESIKLARLQSAGLEVGFDVRCLISVQIENSVQRLSMMRHFHINPEQLQRFKNPVLLVASQGDRLLPSVPEAKRLQQKLPNAEVVILPHSGHACLLETDINLYQIILKVNFINYLAKNT